MTSQTSTGNTTTSTASQPSGDFSAAAALIALSNGVTSSDNFFLKPLAGSLVSMCYGCGNQIRVPPYIPLPPHDFCIVHKEFRAFYAPDGTRKVTKEPQNCHYHLNRQVSLYPLTARKNKNRYPLTVHFVFVSGNVSCSNIPSFMMACLSSQRLSKAF